MKQTLFIASIITLSGCGYRVLTSPPCVVTATPKGYIIACPGSDPVELTNGQTGPQGPQGEQGQVGPQGPVGSAGIQGPVGPKGDVGSTGLSGTPGSSITTIKFCHDDTSTFPEYGVVIGSSIYAVYWGTTPSSSQPEAFLALIIPGHYRSTGGNGCSFTVNSNGTITEN